jgi:DNA-binding transcriptional LysR family regulator
LVDPSDRHPIRRRTHGEQDVPVSDLDIASSEGREVTIADLTDKPLVLRSAQHGLRRPVERAFPLQGAPLNLVAETNAMSVQKSLVMGGHGFTILPTIALVDDVVNGPLAAAPLVAPALLK